MQQKTFFGHPYALSSIFHIELWERFSFYGMKAILFLYLYYEYSQGGLGIDKNIAGGIVGAYGGSVYLSCLVGGWVADRVLGAERTLFYSGIVVMCGHIILALVPGLEGLILGMICIALGSGGVKTTASATLGTLYETDDTRHMRDAGFSIFYIAINIGALLGPLLSGILQHSYGFHYGFGAAAVGMAFGLWMYSRGRKNLPPSPVPNPLNKKEQKQASFSWLALIAIVMVTIFSGFLTLQNFPRILLVCVICLTIGYFARLLMSHQVENKGNIVAFIPLFITISIFWSLWAQFDTAMILYFEQTIDRHFFNFEVPVAWLGSLQSLWVILIAGLLATLWTKMGDKQPKTPLKFAISMLALGVTYFAFSLMVSAQGSSFLLFFFFILLITISELLLSPVSLSLATKIAPKNFQASMVALTFLSYSLGFTLSGVIFKNGFDENDPTSFYEMISGIGLATGILLLLVVPVLNRLLKGKD
ncbi:MFS transporter [Lonepinella koalarum]|uniref:peptide MFS transporter n=1 Tax=Lonepinella koalarum TaxID=53417 RepID=UPI0011E4530E|nr:oligopeptide:H+ symporter [Lonepinella koalarum]TYG33630.1 MFS transporter [Lonepinella koalarum]